MQGDRIVLGKGMLRLAYDVNDYAHSKGIKVGCGAAGLPVVAPTTGRSGWIARGVGVLWLLVVCVALARFGWGVAVGA